jgi:hypothetical protein
MKNDFIDSLYLYYNFKNELINIVDLLLFNNN